MTRRIETALLAYPSVDHDGVRLADGGSLPSGNFAATASAYSCSPVRVLRSASGGSWTPGFATRARAR